MSDRKFAIVEADEPQTRRFSGLLPVGAEKNLRELLLQLWRRRVMLAGTVLLLTALSAVIVFQLTPRYTATAKVMIDPRENQVLNIDSVFSGLPMDVEAIESEVEVLQSRGLAQRVVTQLKLYNDPELNPRLRPKSVWATHLNPQNWAPAFILDIFKSPEPAVQEVESDRQEHERVEIIDQFIRQLSISRGGRSRVLNIRYTSGSAETASTVANTLAELYLVEQLEAKFEATKRATDWLSKRLSDLRANVEASERAVEVFRNESGLVRGKDSTVASQQISELNTQIILARTKRAESEARLRQVETLLRSPGGADSAEEVLSSTLIQKLREQEAEVQRKAAELSQEYGEKHPRMINIRAEIRDIDAKIGAEVTKIVQGLRNEVNVSRAREESLRGSLKDLEDRAAGLNQSEVKLRTLQREANANRTLYEQFLGRFKETSEQKEIHQADARIISRADSPIRPSFPRVTLFIGMAFVASCLIAIALVTVIERLDHGFRSMEQIEQLAGVPSLGLVPSLHGMAGLRKEPQDYILDKPVSAFGEAIRALHAGLLLSNVDRPPKLVLITSAIPNEGKTSLSLSFARMVAKQGQKKVVLVDCDLRRPQVHRKLKLAEKPGLVEYLAGEATLEEVLQLDEPSNALIVSAGRTPANPTDLLTSEHFKDLLRKLSEACDLVILDSSPVLAVSDSRILSRLADKTIFVVRWAETRREVALQGIKQIVEADADLAGVVLSMVNVKKHARYGYGDSGYYYGTYRKYYTS